MAMTSTGTGTSAGMWVRTQLKDVADFRSGQRDTNSAVEEGDFPFFVCSSEILRCDQFDFDDEAVVMAGNNADGIFHMHHFVGKFAARQRTYVITPGTDRLDCRWLFHQLTLLQPQFQAVAIGTTTRYVTIEMLRRAEILLPDVKVQRAICHILRDVDALLDGLDRLIAKKRDLKQAAMQQLLTGQIRLPGFHGKWKVKPLGRVAEIVMGQSPSSSSYNKQGYGLPLIQGNADVANRKTIVRVFTSQITKRGRVGDILMSVRAPVGEVSRATFDVCLGRGVCAIRFPNDFLYHCLIFLEPTWAKHSKGSTFESVNSNDIKAVEIWLPSDVEEQTAIAAVLSDMDAELEALEQRQEKTRDLKRAMMQELLTGKTRLVPAGAAHA
jgi:type I restriction enzyme, S subunit